jgi:hypothetical protein
MPDFDPEYSAGYPEYQPRLHELSDEDFGRQFEPLALTYDPYEAPEVDE